MTYAVLLMGTGRDGSGRHEAYAQLSISSVQFCWSRGYLLRSIMQAAVVVILKGEKNKGRHESRAALGAAVSIVTGESRCGGDVGVWGGGQNTVLKPHPQWPGLIFHDSRHQGCIFSKGAGGWGEGIMFSPHI